jgi:hypothetical protein
MWGLLHSALGEIMTGRYKDENEIYELLRSFENATVSRGEWKHAEHMVVALCYLEEHDVAAATDKMRAGIMNLLTTGFGIDLKKEMPYHETLTVFWMRTVYAYSLMHKEKTLVEKANGLIESFDKDHPLNFYTRDLLFSDEARRIFVNPSIGLVLPS